MSKTAHATPRTLARTLAFALVSIGLGTLLALLLAEGICRILPVSTGVRALPVNASTPIFRFEPDREYVYSTAWNFSIVNRGRTNNEGFVNNQDYAASDARPLLAVIGDSYVEALMVPYSNTLHGRLQRCVEGTGRVYSFAASGAPLSQYLAWAEHAKSRFTPSAMAFVIVGNDFDESLAKYKSAPGFHYFRETMDGKLTLKRYDYTPSRLRKIARSSAFIRYLVLNVHFHSQLAAVWDRLIRPARADNAPAYVGNSSSSTNTQRMRDSMRAIEAFFDELPRRAGLSTSRIVFIMDGIRPQLYQGKEALNQVRNAYFPRMRDYFIHEARQRGYPVVDLQPTFLSTHKNTGAKFEFDDDAHWNSLGHSLAAQALAKTTAIRDLFGVASPPKGTDISNCIRSGTGATPR